jgi:hypothetical protein
MKNFWISEAWDWHQYTDLPDTIGFDHLDNFIKNFPSDNNSYVYLQDVTCSQSDNWFCQHDNISYDEGFIIDE